MKRDTQYDSEGVLSWLLNVALNLVVPVKQESSAMGTLRYRRSGG